MPAPVAFVDCETTGLDPDRHEIWEVGLIAPDGAEHVWILPIDESRADLIALNIGGYFDRPHAPTRPLGLPWFDIESHASRFAHQFQALTRGLHLAGAVVSFDADRLHRLLIAQKVIPAWHYHLIDVEALAVGYVAGNARTRTAFPGAAAMVLDLPWNSTALSITVGVDPDQFERHTALGDARWAKAIYEAVMGS